MSRVLFLVTIVICASVSVSAQTKYDATRVKPGVVYVGPPTTYLKEGLRTQDVVRFLGKPTAISERRENGLVVTTYEFPRGGDRVLIAEFVNDALVRSRIERAVITRPVFLRSSH